MNRSVMNVVCFEREHLQPPANSNSEGKTK